MHRRSILLQSQQHGVALRLLHLSSLILVASILRIVIVRLKETPKFLLGHGRDEEVVSTIRCIALKYNRPCSITVKQLQDCGKMTTAGRVGNSFSKGEILIRLRDLFATRRLAGGTCLIWLSWVFIGLAFPLFNAFLPQYLLSRGTQTGDGSLNLTYKNYALANMSGVFGPMLEGTRT